MLTAVQKKTWWRLFAMVGKPGNQEGLFKQQEYILLLFEQPILNESWQVIIIGPSPVLEAVGIHNTARLVDYLADSLKIWNHILLLLMNPRSLLLFLPR